MKATIHGWNTPLEEFHFEQGVPVYTDGSAVHVQYPEIACSAAAAFQVDSAGKHRLLTVQNDPLGPQSAIAGEAIAVELATYGLSRSPVSKPTPLVVDCQAVVNNLQALPRALGYRHNYAGHFLDTFQTVKLLPVKIKSHMTEAVATQLGIREHWFGNSKADRFANEAGPTPARLAWPTSTTRKPYLHNCYASPPRRPTYPQCSLAHIAKPLPPSRKQGGDPTPTPSPAKERDGSASGAASPLAPPPGK